MTIDEFKKNIAPYMKKGWVAMQQIGGWTYYSSKPEIIYDDWSNFWNGSDGHYEYLGMFDIEPVDNWKESLIEVGNA